MSKRKAKEVSLSDAVLFLAMCLLLAWLLVDHVDKAINHEMQVGSCQYRTVHVARAGEWTYKWLSQ